MSVPEDQLAPGVLEMLASPEHYRRSPMEVVDYSHAPEPEGPWLPSLASPPEVEPSRWARLKAALRR